ncbi:MAG TPA: 4Fe-4S binding protein [Candidatus Bathyarchaeia archaeon]|nr:4Fe-4S binding protein [Candidatus Bathyarchaeia archaeon]
MQPVASSESKLGIGKRTWLMLRRGRIYYWPIRAIVQLSFFLLFAGVALARLIPAFNGARSWVVLPVVASVKAQGTVGSTLDATTLLLSQAIFPWLPIGIMFVVGAVLGRFMCGWICPVGFLQDVITGVKGRVDSVQSRTHEYWIRLKYVLVGITFLISGTLAIALYYGVGSDYQQSLGTDFASGLFIAITPDGTLFGTLPVLLARSWRFLATAQISDISAATIGSGLGSISALTWINILILIGFIYAAWRIPRFWCRYICPVGGIMAVFQKNSLLGMHRDPIKCSNCKECETACPMQIPILDLDWKKFNDSECILCMACIDACPAGALSPKFP